MTRGTEAAVDLRAGSESGRRARERGFTLVELVAVIAIVTLLVAVILPQVASQQTSANPAALGSELRNLQTAAEMFQVHTRTASPGELEHLSHGVTVADLDVWDVPYSGQEVSGWNGPYIDASLRPGLPPDTAAGIESAFDANFCNDLFTVNSGRMDAGWAHPTVMGSDTTCVDFGNVAGADFVAVAVTPLTHDQWSKVDERMDGGNGENVGRVRWSNIGSREPKARGRLIFLLTTLLQ